MDALNPKNFDIIFPVLPPEACMVEALCDERALQLMAPNRVCRESLLLALGIANFNGKPSELTKSSMLFPDMISSRPLEPEKEKVDYSPDESISTSVGVRVGEEGCSSTEDRGSTMTMTEENVPSSILSYATEHEMKGQQKIRALESEIAKLNNMLSAKKDFSCSLQAQVQKAEAELRKKDLEIDILHQDLHLSKKKYQESCGSLALAQKQIQ